MKRLYVSTSTSIRYGLLIVHICATHDTHTYQFSFLLEQPSYKRTGLYVSIPIPLFLVSRPKFYDISNGAFGFSAS